MHTRTSLTRVGAVAATGLVAGSLALLSTGTAHAVTPTPQVTTAEHWVRGMLQDGLLPGKSGSYAYTNYGASADAIISLAEVGDSTDAGTIANALQGQIDKYISGESSGDTGSTYAGSVAKAAVALKAAGIDPATVTTHLGGQPAGDLITRLEATVQASGRIQDTSTYGDYENVLGQAFAVNALTAAGSSKAATAEHFLLSQQCSGGWFRLYLTEGKDAQHNQVGTDTTCNADPKSTPSVDATATAVLNLLPQAGTDATAARAVGRAESWLVSMQHADGGWGDASVGGASDANSTGLAVRALGALGDDVAAARRGAEWLRGTQLTNVASCTPYAAKEVGAIAYDHTAWAAAQTAGVAKSLDQFVVAASQALPALRFLPPATSAPKIAGPTSYVPAGTRVGYSVKGLAPGASACLALGATKGLVASGIAGTATGRLALPAGTGTRTVTVTADGGARSTAVTKALAAKKLFPKVSVARIKVGKKETVTVNGLAANEKVTLKLRSAKVAAGAANARGVFKATFAVKGATGAAKVTATGQFADRTGTKTITVVRAS